MMIDKRETRKCTLAYLTLAKSQQNDAAPGQKID